MAAAKRRRLALTTCSALIGVLASGWAGAQEQVLFAADQIVVSPDGSTVLAIGNVTVDYQDNRLETDTVVYDRVSGDITFPESVTFTTETGEILTANSAMVQDDLVSGVFDQVELQLEGQFRILAEKLERLDQNNSVLTTGIATSCKICNEGSEPIWQIRARSVEHVLDEQRLYFTDAVFEFLGIPVFYAPRIRTPDPSVDRASGFLVPSFRTSNTLGFGVEAPYYLVLGDHADATLTPFASSQGAFLLQGEYRQLFENGAIYAVGAVAFADPLSDDSLRSFATLTGSFDLKNNFILDFEVNATSDRTFRQEYSFGDEDRLENFTTLSKTTSTSYFDLSASTIQSLREGEDTSNIPLVFPEAYFVQKMALGRGWTLGNELHSVSLFRENQRRTNRAGFRSTIQKNAISRFGLAYEFLGRLEGSIYNVEGDPSFDDGSYSYLVPTLAATLRYPLAKQHLNGGRSLIEPIAQIIVAQDDPVDVPNEDSFQLEFEESNLFSLNRFPGFDGVEVGSRVNIGVRYLYEAPDDWRLGVSLGQVFRLDDIDQFTGTVATGLDAQYSDTVLSVTLEYADQFAFTNRTLVGRDFNISKYESQLSYRTDRWNLGLEYIYLEENVIAGTADRQDQIDLNLAYRATSDWTLRTNLRQDFTQSEPIEQFFGAEFRNECIKIDFGLTLDYATGTSNEAEQEFGLTIELLGFGGDTATEGRNSGC